VYLWLVPHATVFMTNFWIHGIVCVCVGVHARVYVWPVSASSWMSIWSFSNSLHLFLICCTPSYCHYHTLLSSGSGFWWTKYVLPIETTSSYTPICRTKFPPSLPLHINLSCHNIWLNECHGICCIFPLLQVIPPLNRYI
jgi:hypothetical protein